MIINNFLQISIKTYVAGRILEAILMSTHKIYFYGKISKIIPKSIRFGVAGKNWQSNRPKLLSVTITQLAAQKK